MLIGLDETLHHQSSRSFASVGVSDHRFFDRYWFGGVHPDGELALITGLGFYKNMGTCDGFAAIQRRRRQHNIRLARPLAEDLGRTGVGPLDFTVIESFKHLHAALAPSESGLAFELDFRSNFPAYAEAHHFQVHHERVTQDSTRYDQVGTWSGWLELEGEHVKVSEWWGARDHSWGVRPNVGGFEPPLNATADPMLWMWACFSIDDFACQFQQREDGDGNRVYFDGQIDYPYDSGKPSERAVSVSHDIAFIPGTRTYEHVRYELTMAGGRLVVIEAEPLVRPWAYRGTGYGGGYHDGKALGAWRGSVLEHDVYDLENPESVLVDGKPHPSGHREQPVRIVVDGKPGFGHMPIMTRGAIARYGLH
jgi:hypothetical protein